MSKKYCIKYTQSQAVHTNITKQLHHGPFPKKEVASDKMQTHNLLLKGS